MSETDAGTLWCERGGSGTGPVLVLLHGLGANGAVWDGLMPLLERHWPGRWLVPDLRGHGRSFHRAPYGMGQHAADVAALLDAGDEAVLVGHSMGGVVAVALAAGLFGVAVRLAVASSVKVDWTDEERARGRAIAAAPVKLFEERTQAAERCILVAGLKGLVMPDSRFADAGTVARPDGFALATDPLINIGGDYDLAALAAAARAPLHLLTGEHDAMGTAAGMGRLGHDVTVFAGLGHNPHVEAPEIFWQAIAGALPSQRESDA